VDARQRSENRLGLWLIFFVSRIPPEVPGSGWNRRDGVAAICSEQKRLVCVEVLVLRRHSLALARRSRTGSAERARQRRPSSFQNPASNAGIRPCTRGNRVWSRSHMEFYTGDGSRLGALLSQTPGAGAANRNIATGIQDICSRVLRACAESG
jgi:hypothetical protein